MTYPLISVIIPTYNSEGTLALVLEAIKRQTYPKSKIEVLVVDGGSKDSTVKIARKYHAKIVKNDKVHQVFAKHLGFIKSKGKYIVHLDSDEVLENENSFKLKYLTFKKNKNVRAVVSSGYKSPIDFSSANVIVNEYGDPFSFFLYRNSTTFGFYEKMMKRSGEIVLEDNECFIIDQMNSTVLPLIELSVMGYTIDKEYIKKIFPELENEPYLISHLYYMIANKGGLFGFVKDDAVLHHSTSSFKKYLKKVRSRVVNNVYKTEMGMSAFSGRDKYYPFWFKYKKYMFIPYSLSIIFPFIDGIHLAITRKKVVYLIHPILCLQVVVLVTYYYVIKSWGIKPEMRPWGL